jgi:hypothetical protein
MSNFSEQYRQAIEASLKAFVKNGNDVICAGYYVLEYGQCQMCTHAPIKWHYILENLGSGRSLIVGSECVTNYQTILAEWGYKPEYIVFSERLSAGTGWILEKNPNAIIFNDGIVMRMSVDCGAIIAARQQKGKMDHYVYVQPTGSGDSASLEVVRQDTLKEPAKDPNGNDDENDDGGDIPF